MVIFGAGGSAREIAWMIQTQCQQFDLKAFVETEGGRHIGESVNGIPCISVEALKNSGVSSCVIAVGSGQIREKIYQDIIKPLAINREVIVSDQAICDMATTMIGEGSTIAAGSIITTNVAIGKDVQVNIGCTISHDGVIGDYTTISPSVNIAGTVHIDSHVFIGIGATIINGSSKKPLSIGKGAVIAAGAVVTDDVPAYTMVAGCPAVVKRQVDRP